MESQTAYPKHLDNETTTQNINTFYKALKSKQISQYRDGKTGPDPSAGKCGYCLVIDKK